MLAKRVIPCLDVRDGKLTKGIKFAHNVDIGDPVESARKYYEEGADEIVFYDITASAEKRKIFIDVVERVASTIFIPFSVGGGISSVDDMHEVLTAGAEKISINSAAVRNPHLISEGADAFGSQAIVVGMDVLQVPATPEIPSGYEIVINGGRKRMGLDYMPGRDEYDLSLGDLCMIEHLAELKQAGVSCIKLEGRMKRAEYVAVVTRAYRDALDGADKAEISRHKKRMLDMFDRGGGCTGYFYGDNAHTGCIAVSDRSKELIEEAANSYAKDTRKQPVDMELYMRVGEAARLAMCLGGDNVEAVGDVVQPAQKPQTAERYMEQARKLGDTPFICAGIRADIDEKAFLPMSAVNALRRDASAKLLESLHWRRSCDSGDVPKLKNQPAEHTRITVIASTLDQAKAALGAGADEVALEPWEFHIAAFEAAAAFKGSKKLLISLPVAIISHKEAEKIMKIIGSGLIDGGIAANVGQLELIRSLPLRIAGTQMNAMNGYTVQAYKDMGFDRVTLSLELTKPQLRDISGAGTAVSVYGRAQLMQLRHCPVKEYRGCRSCDGFTGKMVDEGGREFPLCNVRQEDGCLVRLLNCLPTDITDLYGELPEPEAVQLAFYDEAPEKVRERIAAAMAARDGRKVSPAKNATRGHWNRAVD